MPLLADFRDLDRRVFILAAARLVVTLGFAAVLPYLGVTLHQERGVSKTIVGLIWLAAGLSGAAMQWVAGEVTDRVGRRPVLLVAMVLRTANLAAMGYELLHDGPVLVIAALCVLNSMLRAFFDPVASAMVADLAAGHRRVAAFSLQRVGINIGWALGSMALGIAHSLHFAYGHVFYASAVMTVLATVAASAIAETRLAVTAPTTSTTATGATGATGAAARSPLLRMPKLSDLFAFTDDRPFTRLLVASLFFFLLQAQLYAPLSLYASDALRMDVGAVSQIYSLNGLLVVLLQLPAFYYIRRSGTDRVLVTGAFGYALSYALCGLAANRGQLLACVALVTLSEIISVPAQQTAATTLAPAHRIGAYAGLFGLTQAVGQSVGPFIGTALLDALPDRLAWPLLALFGVAAALLFRRRLAPAAAAPLPQKLGTG